MQFQHTIERRPSFASRCGSAVKTDRAREYRVRIEIERLKIAGRKLSKFAGCVAVGSALLLSHAAASDAAAANKKYAGFVIDANNGHVLYSDRADEYRYPASLTKMMTLYLTFDALKRGQIRLDSAMPVSSYASARPPSKLGLRAGSTLRVEEAIYSLVTKSANDAAVVLAETLGGSESEFARKMTSTARQLGMSRTIFKNANGLPDGEQHTTARDMATLGLALREHFPQYYSYFSTPSFSFRGRRIGNHNRVLGRVKGADGIKTGYTNASGFNLVTSVEQGGKSVVGVVMGGRSGRSRDDHMVELMTKYLPRASSRDAGPLIASRKTVDTGSYEVASAGTDLPKTGPVPDRRPMSETSIDDRIALAYGSDTGSIISRMPEPTSRPIVGRSALAAALVQERPARMQIPTASRRFPMPPAAIPGGRDLDPNTTGSIATAATTQAPTTANSPWVVQIAAAPGAEQAMQMLADARSKVGGPLAKAEPFTESIKSGSQTLYRARFAGFTTKDQARAACDALKRKSYNCYAVAN